MAAATSPQPGDARGTSPQAGLARRLTGSDTFAAQVARRMRDQLVGARATEKRTTSTPPSTRPPRPR